MDIHRVVGPLVMTRRLAGMGQLPCKVLRGVRGSITVAMDPLGAKPGDWVFTIANSAARRAAGDDALLTDLTVGGLIDYWEPDDEAGPNGG